MQHRRVFALARPFITTQHRLVARVLGVAERSVDHVRELCRILQTKVSALPGEGVHSVCGIANESDARHDILRSVART